MYKRKILYFMTGIVAGVFLLSGVAYASSASSRLKEAQDKQQEAKENIDETKDNISSLNDERASLQEYIDALNERLKTASTELAEIEGLIADKEQRLTETQEELQEAKDSQAEQYASMKSRIQFMYECGDMAYLELFFSSSSFSEFLNKNEYVTKLTEYDRQMLQEYVELQEQIEQEEDDLKDAQTSLTALKTEADEKTQDVTLIVQEAGKNLQKYKDEIDAQEQKMLAYEAEYERQNNSILSLQAEIKANQKLTEASVMRDLSNVTINAGDLDLMAAIIECEAGGESYTGKVAVGAVVMNRVKSSSFPNTILEVIYQNRQFSPVASGRFAVVLARGANETCYQAARDAMSGVSPVGDRLFFRTPIPGLTGLQIGGHIFY